MAAYFTRSLRVILPAALVLGVTLSLTAQTRVVPPANKYKPADDVKLGQEAATQARKELPLLEDRQVSEWVDRVGRRLVGAIPADLQHAEFKYSFDEVNQKEINAFALPGGPMFLNRGMIQAAKTEGEVAGVMGHELAHVFLRHGTAQATKGQKFQIGAVAGQVLGAIVGGTAGSIIAQGSNFGLGAYFMKFSREYETQADIMGAQLLARAGYDPREMANMFKTIQGEGGSGGPEWLSSHPDPGNRYQAIIKESQSLRIEGGGIAPNDEFRTVQARLTSMPAAYTAEQIAQMQKTGNVGNGNTSASGSTTPTRTVQVQAPSGQYRTYRAGNLLRLSVPANWGPRGGEKTVTYTPDGAYFQGQNGTAFTHGIELGLTQGTGNLARDTTALLQSFAQSNPQLRQQGNTASDNIGGRVGFTATLSNVSEVTGQAEVVELSTTQLRDGQVLYVIGVAPRQDVPTYSSVFRRVRQNLQITDR
ncbi:MAG: M48 family metallopeptidase [Vicinamibacterales bacterium]